MNLIGARRFEDTSPHKDLGPPRLAAHPLDASLKFFAFRELSSESSWL